MELENKRFAVAEATRICNRNAFVATSKLVFCQAADAAKICRAEDIEQAEFGKPAVIWTSEESVTTSKLIFHQATDPHCVHGEHHVHSKHRDVVRRTPFESLCHMSVLLFSVQPLHWAILPPVKTPPSESPSSNYV